LRLGFGINLVFKHCPPDLGISPHAVRLCRQVIDLDDDVSHANIQSNIIRQEINHFCVDRVAHISGQLERMAWQRMAWGI
jgi:hypothetical protein